MDGALGHVLASPETRWALIPLWGGAASQNLCWNCSSAPMPRLCLLPTNLAQDAFPSKIRRVQLQIPSISPDSRVWQERCLWNWRCPIPAPSTGHSQPRLQSGRSLLIVLINLHSAGEAAPGLDCPAGIQDNPRIAEASSQDGPRSQKGWKWIWGPLTSKPFPLLMPSG